MTTDAILDRLAVCNAEIVGIARVDRLLPTKPILTDDLPMLYAEALGMTQPAPGNRSAGQYVVARRYRLTLLVAQTALVSFDAPGEGSALYADIMPYLDLVVDYYMRNPRLSTEAGSGADSLNLDQDVAIQDSGPIIRSGPGGGNYGQVQFIMTIAEQRFPTRQRLS